jgi:hypothetical protein
LPERKVDIYFPTWKVMEGRKQLEGANNVLARGGHRNESDVSDGQH